MVIKKKLPGRKEEIFRDYLQMIDRHLDDILSGRAETMYELRDIAGALHIHPTHLSNVIKEHTGKAPCFFYEQKILKVAKTLLTDLSRSIADVARLLTYDPSNFTKWFRFFTGMTPREFRKQVQAGASAQKTEAVTI